jgi:hypothetical protein
MVLALAALGPVVEGKETPASTYAARLATLPAPSAKGAWTFKGQLLFGGNAVGKATLGAEARTAPNGKAFWAVGMQMDVGGGAMKYDALALFDAQLKPLQGKLTTKQGETVKSTEWETVEAGIRIGKGDDAQVLEHEGPFLTSVASLLHFCRLSSFAPGSYATDLFDPDDKEFIAGSWTVGTVGMWAGVKAQLVTGERADGKTIAAGFDPATGALLGIKMTDPENGQIIEFRAGGEESKADTDLFARMARTPQEAAVQGAYAFAVADFDLLEQVMHWPTIAEETRAKSADMAEMDDDAIKGVVMEQLRGTLTPKGPKEVIGPMLAALAPSLPTKDQEDGTQIVAFGPTFRNLELTVGAFDGRWYVVRFPSR